MRKTILLLFIILNSLNLMYAQKQFENKQYEFKIQEPNNWIEASNKELIKNLEKFDVTEENLTKLISDNKGSILLTSFYKYNPKTHTGIIPTIQVNVRTKGNIDFTQFKNSMTESTKSFKTYFEDFEFIKNVTEIEISGIKSICFIGKFTMKTQDGQELKVRSRTYAIPYKNYFFQVNFTDGPLDEDCTAEFDGLVKTIKVGSKN
ncbi:hypothetical protein [Chryseobacterium sp. Hurlbut01]|uniref:hypothetical protein n=1 Tax=Chryseobacterium sp. Hurlbut01 TaxID=1681828 RepID=UPI00128C012D|nr:hypothetical protein [Chryseobacterium sp. Hurlbut01]